MRKKIKSDRITMKKGKEKRHDETERMEEKER